MKRYQVVGIGNAMVDVLWRAPEGFLERHGVEKGIMEMIDMDRAVELYAAIGAAKEVSGGSAANTIAGIAALGGRTAYVGKVKADQLGEIFAHDLRAQGTVYETPPAPPDHPAQTGRCIVLVTPDGERSMNTYLGVNDFLTPADIDESMMAEAEWIYLEGYRLEGSDCAATFAKAIRAAKTAGGKVSVTLSDPLCVERHRESFRRILKDHADLLFCNRAELLSMYETEDFGAARAAAARDVRMVACTDSGGGAHVLTAGGAVHVPTDPVDVVDATGAGDMFAAGFLWGLCEGRDPETCARMGNAAAGEIISHMGARAEADLTGLFGEKGLLRGRGGPG